MRTGGGPAHRQAAAGADAGTVRAGIVLGAVLLVLLGAMAWERIATGRNDFAQLYAGATLAGTPHLYSPDANNAVIGRATGVLMDNVTYSRLPFYASLLKPLTLLPYRYAYYTFAILNLCAAVALAAMFRRECPELPLFAALSVPTFLALAQGQDTPLLALLAGAAVLLRRNGREFAAGLVLALCSIKFHLFLPLAAALVVHRRRRMLAGGIAGGAVLFAWSTAVAGLDWPGEYARLLSSGYLDSSADKMPNVHGMTAAFPALEIPVYAAVAILFLYLARTIRDFDAVFGLSMFAGVLLSRHAYAQDCVLLLLGFALVAPATADAPLRAATALVTTPPVYFLLLVPSWSALVPAAIVAVLGLAYRSRQNFSASDRRT